MTMEKKNQKTPKCFGDYVVGQPSAERGCLSCKHEPACIEEGVRGEQKRPASATKLDAGKPKLSLLHHEFVEMVLPKASDETDAISDAISSLSRAAHATNDVDFSLHLYRAIQKIVEYLEGPKEAMVAATRAMEYGITKPEYGRNNWKKGFEWSRLIDAAMRHGLAIVSGEMIDPDSGNEHIAHMLGAINMLAGNYAMKIGVNDIY